MAVNNDLEHAKRKISLARLEESELNPVIQSLTLQDGQDDIFMLQLNAELAATLTEGGVLTIRGDPEDTAVICSDSATYELKEAETSNSLLLLEELRWPEECENAGMELVPQNINGIFHTYFELRCMKPNFRKLRQLLAKSAYQGKEYEDAASLDLFTFDMLLNTIQSSEDELKNELDQIQACTINGYVRVLDFDYKFGILSSMINVIESHSMPLDKVAKEPIISALEEMEPRELLEQCFTWFTVESEHSGAEGHKLYTLKEDLVCKLYAEVLLRSAGKFHLQDFLESWKRSVPEGMKCDLDQLRGVALTDLSSTPKVIFSFPVHDLPENIKERFEYLFSIKEKWAYDEIVPYLEDRTSPGTDVKALLIKYTRESTKDGKKMYSSKW